MRSCSIMNCAWSCTINESRACLVWVTMTRLESICAMYFSLISCSLSMAIDSLSELSLSPPMWKTRKNTPHRITTDSARMTRVYMFLVLSMLFKVSVS